MEIYKVLVVLCGLNQPLADCDRHTARVKMHGLPYTCMLHAQKIAKQYIRPGQNVRLVKCKPDPR